MAFFTGKKICEGCGKDCTNGLWAPGLATGGQLSEKMLRQLKEFQQRYGKTQMLWCWECFAERMGAKPLDEIQRGKLPSEISVEQQDENKPELVAKGLKDGSSDI